MHLVAKLFKGLFTWRWGTPGRWGSSPRPGRKIKRVYTQSYNPGVLGWGFLRLLLHLQLRSLSRGVPGSHLEKDEKLILGHIFIYSWKRHALCYALLGYARNRWLITLYGIVWETKYGRFTTLNNLKCEHFTLFVCPLQFLVISAMRRLGNVQSLKHTCFAFELFAMNGQAGHPTLRRLHGKLSPRLTGLPYPADQATLLGGSPHLSHKRDQDKIRNFMDRRVTSPAWGPPPPCK